MKLIRAYLRKAVIADVTYALIKAGAQWLNVVHVMGLGEEMSRMHRALASENGEYLEYTEMAKLEFLCNEPCVDVALDIIRKLAAHGWENDGIIAISPLEEVISVRTGERGKKLLCHLNQLSEEEVDKLKEKLA